MENKEKKGIFEAVYAWFEGLTLKGLLGAILISFVVIIFLLSASYIPAALSRMSSSLSAALYSVFVPTENATMTIDKQIINSGEDFTINFKKQGDSVGMFTISYACDLNTSLVSVEAAGLKKIECDTPYYLLENETSIKIRPITEVSVVRLVVDGAFENNETQKTDKVGVSRVTIKNNTVGEIINTPQNNTVATTTVSVISKPVVAPTYIPQAAQTIYFGKSDLAVRILQLGILDNRTNLITNRTQFSYQDMVGIKFEIRNDGDADTGTWSFNATLPSISTPTYSSNIQPSLRPGESIIFTLGFSSLTNQYNSIITITADPYGVVSESNEVNNILTFPITNSSYNSNYYTNYNNYNNNYSNGCYVNGIYTTNCYNNYNNGWGYINYNYGYSNLNVSCYATPTDPETGDRVRWYANASGGDGDYTYEWTGTNGLDTSVHNPTKTYSSRGIKYATVTVISDGYQVSQTCSVYVN